MKKVFFAVALVATLGLALVSCNKDEKKCWEVSVSMDNMVYKQYLWKSQNEIDVYKEQMKNEGYVVSSVKAASKYTTFDACNSQNGGEGEW